MSCIARTLVHISRCTADPLCLGNKDPVSLAAHPPPGQAVLCVCGSLAGMGNNAWVGAEQLLSKNCPGAGVFVVMGPEGLEGRL